MADAAAAGSFFRKAASNFFGAFSDGAVLIPLVVALSMGSGFSGGMLLASSGMAYIVAGLLFRIPMPVQPLKSVAVAAVAVGASLSEVRLAGILVGLSCVLLTLPNINEIAARVPRSLVHGLQLALGLILVINGWLGLAGRADPATMGLLALLVAAILASSKFLGFPLLGMVATGGLVWSLFSPGSVREAASLPEFSLELGSVRWGLVTGLFLPQIVLTLGNSVVATCDVAQRYFGPARARRISPRALLLSIGFGNLISSALAGLPYCHGSGGLTAHVKGGSTSWLSNLIVGVFLIVVSALHFAGGGIALGYPALLLAALLVSVGMFHMQLAKPTWESRERGCLLGMGAMAVITQNMLYVLLCGIAWQTAAWFLSNRAAKAMRASLTDI